jgi:hypothetical protein
MKRIAYLDQGSTPNFWRWVAKFFSPEQAKYITARRARELGVLQDSRRVMDQKGNLWPERQAL